MSNNKHLKAYIEYLEKQIEEIVKETPNKLVKFIEEHQDKLKGADGKDGADGVDGQDGQDGIDGKDGKDGKDGVTPVKGKDYFTKKEIKQIARDASSLIKIPEQKPFKLNKKQKDELLDYIAERIVIEKVSGIDVVEMLEDLPDKQKLDPEKGLKNFKNAVRRVQQKQGGGISKGFADGRYVNHGADGRGTEVLDYVAYNTAYTANGEPVGTMFWDSDEETLSVKVSPNVTQDLNEIHFTVKNQTGADIDDGTFVMFAGTVGNSGRFLIQKGIADGSINSEYTMGLTTEPIADGENGKVTWFGKVKGINTTGTPYGETWNDGDIIYASPTTAGALTNVKPTSPDRIIIVAAVIHAASNGILYIRPHWYERLGELDDVFIASVSNGDILFYNSNNNRWENTSRRVYSKEVITGTATINSAYLHVCDSVTAFTLTITDGNLDGESIKIVNRGVGKVTLSGNINTVTAVDSLIEGESIELVWDTVDLQWQ